MSQRRGPDGTVRVAVNGHIKAEPWTNVFWANLVGGTTATQAALDAWTSAFRTAYVTDILNAVTADSTLSTVQSTLFQPGETALHSVITTPATGSGVGTLVKNLASCRVLSWNTSVYWRGGKPRTYIAGLNQVDTDDDQTLNASAVAFWQNAGNNLHTGINALSATGITQTQHGFVSFQSGGALRNPSVFFPISGCVVHPRIGTQRGRLGAWKA